MAPPINQNQPVIPANHLNPIVDAFPDFLHLPVQIISSRAIAIIDFASPAVYGLYQKIESMVYDRRHMIFFVLSNVVAASAYPHVFLAGVPIGALAAFLIGSATQNYTHDEEFYLCKRFSYEASIAQFTLGQISLIDKIVTYLNRHRFGHQEAIIPSLLSGMIAGAFLHSSTTLLIASLRA